MINFQRLDLNLLRPLDGLRQQIVMSLEGKPC